MREEVPQLWKNGVDIRGTDPKPKRQCRGILIDGSRRYPPATSIGIVRAAQLECRENTIEVTTEDGSPHYQMMITPRVVCTHIIAARTGRLECATKVGKRKRDNLFVDPKLDGSIIEGSHCFADLCQQRLLCGNLILVRVKTAQ